MGPAAHTQPTLSQLLMPIAEALDALHNNRTHPLGRYFFGIDFPKRDLLRNGGGRGILRSKI